MTYFIQENNDKNEGDFLQEKKIGIQEEIEQNPFKVLKRSENINIEIYILATLVLKLMLK